MKFAIFLCFLNVFKSSVSLEHVWHSYQFESIHRNREELQITNITSDDQFELNFRVLKWKSVCSENICFLAGIMEKNLAVVTLTQNAGKTGFSYKSYEIELSQRPLDVAFFQNWNVTLKETETIAVAATRTKLLWYKIGKTNYTNFWSWSFQDKNITHINFFEKDYTYHLLIIGTYFSETTGDLYQFELESPNFWLFQKLQLTEPTTASTAISAGADFFIAIPQQSLQLVLVYKFRNNRFISYHNLSSSGVDNVISFKIWQKSFLAFNGLDAGIYKFGKDGLIREDIVNSHLDGVNYWLPIPLSEFDEVILIAQRSLHHGLHKSFVIEVITYNGDKFEEHEDVSCSYFGEDSLSLSCLPGEESETGIWGSAAICLGNVLGLLIPRKNKSELFKMTTDIKKIESPIDVELGELRERRTYLEDLMQSQQKIYAEIVAKPEVPDFEKMKHQLDVVNQDILKLKEDETIKKKITHYNKVIFNNRVEIQEDGIFVQAELEKINGNPAGKILNDIVLSGNMGKILGQKFFANLTTDALEVKQINEVMSENLLFSAKNITIDDDLILEAPLIAVNNVTAGQVNSLNFENEIIDVRSQPEELVLESIEILGNVAVNEINERRIPLSPVKDFKIIESDTLEFPLNIKVNKVNGEHFQTFLQQLCLRNIDTQIPGSIKIRGNITIRENVQTDYLNDLEFPMEYVFIHPSFPNVTGTKTFLNSLTLNEMHCEGTVNDIDLSDVIMLTSDQIIPGTTTFKNLKITEKLIVDGNVTGEHASKFLPNPTLLETDFVTAKVSFKNLEVDGSIILTEQFNGDDFESLLNDIIYVDEKNVVVEGLKQFLETIVVRQNLEIKSNSINNIDLDTIITKDSNQVLNISALDGIVTFANIETGGLYNSVDIRLLDDELIKLDGEQFISSTLIFEEEPEFTNGFVVLDNVTKLKQDYNKIVILDDLFDFNSLEVESVLVKGNFNGKIEDFDLQEFDTKRMSFTKDQIIEADYIIQNVSVTQINPITINDVDSYQFSRQGLEDKFKTHLFAGSLEVDDLYVNNSLDIDYVNLKPAMNFGGSLWKDDIKKFNLTVLNFKEDTYFSDVKIQNLSGVGFQRFLNNLIFKNETDVTFSGRKIFLNDLFIEKLVETEKLNYVPLNNILTRHGEQEVSGPITINGNTLFDKDLIVSKHINDIPINVISNQYEVNDEQYTIHGDILFNRLPHIHNLKIRGYVNDRLAQEIVDDVIYKDGDFKLFGATVFKNDVEVDGNIRVLNNINNVDLPLMVSKMVMITKDIQIRTQVRFRDPVFVENRISVHSNLEAEDLNGVDLEYWMENAIFVNRGYLKGKYNFEEVVIGDNLKTEFINNIDVDTLIPLRTNQNLLDLTFDEVSTFNDIQVGNSTNFYNLPEEFDNTVLINSAQDIESDLEFLGSVFIEGNMDLLGLLNEMNTTRIVTTNTDQQLSAVYNFKSKSVIDGNLLVKGLVNGINMTSWWLEGIKMFPHPQNITDEWLVQDLVFEHETKGNALINGLNVRSFAQDIDDKRRYKYEMEKGFVDDYKNICKDLTFMYEKLKKQIYKFNYFENLEMLRFQNKIQYVYSFEYKNNFYLLISEKGRCDSHLFVFTGHFRFVKTVEFGLISQIIAVGVNDLLYLVIRNQPIYSLCKVQGTNLWQMIDDGFLRLANVDDQDILQESLVPGVFYGLSDSIVTEFKIVESEQILRKSRRWNVRSESDNMAFVPRGLATGLALRTGQKLIRLNRDDQTSEESSFDTENIIRGNVTEEFNPYLPGYKDGDLVVLKVGVKSTRRSLLAVASHEETSIKGSLDFIKIYEDIVSGKVFQKIATYKPSSLVSLEFENGETLLAFMENENVLQVYQYKGIEGFKHKLSAKLGASKLFVLTIKQYKKEMKLLAALDKNKINFIEAVMLGNQIEENLKCSLY